MAQAFWTALPPLPCLHSLSPLASPLTAVLARVVLEQLHAVVGLPLERQPPPSHLQQLRAQLRMAVAVGGSGWCVYRGESKVVTVATVIVSALARERQQ